MHSHTESVSDHKQHFPAFSSLLMRKGPSAVFRDWLDNISYHMDSIRADTPEQPRHVTQQYQRLRARFALVQEEAYKCCAMIDHLPPAEKKEIAVRSIPRFMWALSSLKSEASELVGSGAQMA